MAQPYLNEGVLESVLEDWCLRIVLPPLLTRAGAIVAGICPAGRGRCAIEIETDDGR